MAESLWQYGAACAQVGALQCEDGARPIKAVEVFDFAGRSIRLPWEHAVAVAGKILAKQTAELGKAGYRVEIVTDEHTVAWLTKGKLPPPGDVPFGTVPVDAIAEEPTEKPGGLYFFCHECGKVSVDKNWFEEVDGVVAFTNHEDAACRYCDSRDGMVSRLLEE